MALPLTKFASRCEQVALATGNITPLSSHSVLLYGISNEWRKLYTATDFKSKILPGWSEKEVGAAQVIIASLTYLRRVGCNNIEQLLKETVELNARHK